jgi:hypothetical protein
MRATVTVNSQSALSAAACRQQCQRFFARDVLLKISGAVLWPRAEIAPVLRYVGMFRNFSGDLFHAWCELLIIQRRSYFFGVRLRVGDDHRVAFESLSYFV